MATTSRYLFAILLLLVLLPAHSADIRLAPFDPSSPDSSEVVVISGLIEPGDYDRLRDLAKRDAKLFHARTFVLASLGGDIEEAVRIGRLLRSMYASVFVSSKHGKCASACFFIYVAAIDRNATIPDLGIHRPYLNPKRYAQLSLEASEQKYRELSEVVRSYLVEHQVPSSIIERMFNLASSEIQWLDAVDLKAVGRRAPWWDQVLVDRCKLDKQLEAEYYWLRPGSHIEAMAEKAEKHFHDVAQCAYFLSAEDRGRATRSLLSDHPRRLK